MALLAVVLILVLWLVLWLKEKLTPENPPVDDINKHCKTIQQLPDKKARQKYLRKNSRS